LKLKKSLTSSPTLLYQDPTKPFIVECDASSYAIGAILSQRDDENRLHPVTYYSRSLNNAELNYSITEKELLAIKSAFSTWRHLLLGAKHQITVFTDHKNLLYTLGGKVGNQHQHRWHLFFQDYNFQLIYRQGRKNGKPDSLSRRPDYEKNVEEPKPENILDSKNVPIVPSFVGIVGSLINQIIENYEGDETADDIKLYFSPNNANQGYFYKPFRKMEKFEIKNKIILYNNLVYVPEKLRFDIFTRYHDKPTAGHLGIRRTEELITRNFWWTKLHQDVVSFVNSCEQCQRNKVSHHKKYDLLRPLEIPDRPWKSIEIDFLCGLPEFKKFTVIMVIVDRFSKIINHIPFKEIPSAEETDKAFLKTIFKLHGLPVDIYTDRGSHFTSALWIEIMEKLRIKQRIATIDLLTVFEEKQANTLPPYRQYELKIDIIPGGQLYFGHIYSLTVTELKALKDYIKENLKGFIRKSKSPSGSPVIFVKKHDSLRLCVDYRKLNAITIINSYPIPRLQNLIESFKSAVIFTQLDLRSTYNIVRVKEGHEYLTCFVPH